MTGATALRLIPSPAGDLAEGLRAAVADPVWFLARQWQLGEHRGEDSASPVTVAYHVVALPISDTGPPTQRLQRIPAEAVLEGQPDDWWTLGRRIDYGLHFQHLIRTHNRELTVADPHPLNDLEEHAPRLTGLPVPYIPFEGALDGRALHPGLVDLLAPGELELDDGLRQGLERLVASVPTNRPGRRPRLVPPSPHPIAPVNHWKGDQLWYDSDTMVAGQPGGRVRLPVRRHTGGRVDWYTIDASDDLDAAVDAALAAPNPATMAALPVPLRFPGSPDPRWWAMEDHATDLGSYSPDQTQAGAMLLTDLVNSHGDGWFTFPVGGSGQAVGSLVVLHTVVVTDAFDDTHQLSADPTNGELFRLAKDQPHPSQRCCALALWPTVTLPLRADTPLDEVLLVVDQDANAVWAQERRVTGQPQTNLTRDDDQASDTPGQTLDTSAPPTFQYHPMLLRGDRWYLYTPAPGTRLLTRRAVRNPDTRASAAEPKTSLLPKTLDPSSIPWTGIRVERRYVLARAAGDGAPILWTERTTRTLDDQPAVLLRFDTTTRTV